MNKFNQWVQANQVAWDKRTQVHTHKSSDSYDIAGFKNGNTSLDKIELEELNDVKGKSMLHLQCHFGLDTLSWTREGVERVTGVDLSPEAIRYARQLAEECQIDNAQFICSDVLKLKDKLDDQFDIVFTSHGVLDWLPDLNQWANIIAHYLKPGGTFYIVEFHPVMHMLDEAFENLSWPYFYDKENPLIMEEDVSYANQDIECKHTTIEWPHTFGDIITALQKVGIIIEFLHEYDYVPFNCFNNLEETEEGKFVVKGKANLPLMFSLKATYLPHVRLK